MDRDTVGRWLRSRTGTILAAGILVGLASVALRETGLLQGAELDLYDAALRVRMERAEPEPRVVLVEIEEGDIHALGHPLPDATLAAGLQNLLAGEPRVVGVDLIRDLPVPPGSDALAMAFADPRVVGIEKFPDADGRGGIAPPPALVGTGRIGFSDQYLDGDSNVRRGLLFVGQDGRTGVAFSLQVALRYLAAEGITLEPNADDPNRVRIAGTEITPFRGEDGAYVRADDGGYQYLLDYHVPTAFTAYGFSDVVDGRIPRDALRDRIVLVGTTATSVKDLFMSPAGVVIGGARQLYGLELHAHQTSQLLRVALDGHVPTAVPSRTTESAWIVSVALVGAALGAAFPSFTWLALSLLAGGLLLFGIGAAAFAAGWWVPVLPPLLAFAAAAAGAVTAMLRSERIDRRRLRRLFNSYVSESVVERLLDDREALLADGRPRSRRVEATILMADLEGFTRAAEGMKPEQVMAWVSEYLGAMASVIDDHDGIVDAYAGDGIKADFGVLDPDHPEQVEAFARRAVDCALVMAQEMARLNTQWKQENKPQVRLRIGIHTGPVVVGSVGSATRLSYTTLGDTVNTAARIEGYEKDSLKGTDATRHRILVSGDTLSKLGAGYQTECLGEPTFRGKTRAVGVHRLIGRDGGHAAHGGEGGDT